MTVGASVNFSILLLLLPGALNSSRISQTPAAVIVRPKESSSLSCSHNTSNVFYMYWYRRPAQSRALTLVGYLYSDTANLETDFTNDRFGLQGNAGSRGDLQISDPTTEDSGEYFCATSRDTYSEAYFGAGTKLTVLESGLLVTPPTVKVLPPSTKECEDRNKKKKKTLVCVATDFYPDHVTVFWRLNGGANITDGVGTDNTALRGNKLYSITSRLRVPAKKWNKASNRFTCTVRFFNGTTDIYVADHINGEEGQGGDGGITTEYYVRSTKTAKLAYSIFIAKSTFYGLVVMALIWKFQRSSDKQM